MPSLKDRLVQVLLSRELMTQEQLDEALVLQHKQHGSLQQILVEHGYVKEQDLLSAVSQGLGIPPISLARLRLDPKLRGLIPRDMATQYLIVPVSCMGQTLTVAMADPLNVFALDTVAMMTGLTINPMITTVKDIHDAIDQFYGTGVESTLEQMAKQAKADAALEVLSDDRAEETDERKLLELTEEAPVIKYTDAILAKAVRSHASDILIEPRETTVRVRYRIDGILQETQAPPKHLHSAVVSRIKIMSELNIAERRLPQDGHFKFKVDDRPIDFRVSILPSVFGGNVCLRILDKGEVKLDIDTLGFDPNDVLRLKACAQRPHGMLLATGPTASGKTTTLYSLLKMIDRPEKNIVTVEEPVEFDLPGINQVNVKNEVGLTFAKALRSILRQDPDIIMVGEIRDSETADMAVKSALTGHLVLSTLHTNSAAGCVIRLVNMGVEPFLLNSCLMAAVGQRLVRRICSRCKEPYQLTKKVAEQLGLLAPNGEPLELMRGAGCRTCFKSGYVGREVIAETLIMTPKIRELVLKRAAEREVEQAARDEGMKTLREQALAKVAQQITTLDEVFRTTVGEVVG